MKLDLDEIERENPNAPLMIALIAYIRALEAQARPTIEATGLTVEDEIVALDAIVEKGAVMP